MIDGLRTYSILLLIAAASLAGCDYAVPEAERTNVYDPEAPGYRPTTPGMMKAREEGGLIELEWKDGSLDEDGYVVSRQLIGVDERPLEIAEVGHDVTSYVDSLALHELPEVKDVLYSVRAFVTREDRRRRSEPVSLRLRASTWSETNVSFDPSSHEIEAQWEEEAEGASVTLSRFHPETGSWVALDDVAPATGEASGAIRERSLAPLLVRLQLLDEEGFRLAQHLTTIERRRAYEPTPRVRLPDESAIAVDLLRNPCECGDFFRVYRVRSPYSEPILLAETSSMEEVARIEASSYINEETTFGVQVVENGIETTVGAQAFFAEVRRPKLRLTADASIELEWEAHPKAVEYRLYRATRYVENDRELIARLDASQNSYTDDEVASEEIAYTYWLSTATSKMSAPRSVSWRYTWTQETAFDLPADFDASSAQVRWRPGADQFALWETGSVPQQALLVDLTGGVRESWNAEQISEMTFNADGHLLSLNDMEAPRLRVIDLNSGETIFDRSDVYWSSAVLRPQGDAVIAIERGDRLDRVDLADGTFDDYLRLEFWSSTPSGSGDRDSLVLAYDVTTDEVYVTSRFGPVSVHEADGLSRFRTYVGISATERYEVAPDGGSLLSIYRGLHISSLGPGRGWHEPEAVDGAFGAAREVAVVQATLLAGETRVDVRSQDGGLPVGKVAGELSPASAVDFDQTGDRFVLVLRDGTVQIRRRGQGQWSRVTD